VSLTYKKGERLLVALDRQSAKRAGSRPLPQGPTLTCSLAAILLGRVAPRRAAVDPDRSCCDPDLLRLLSQILNNHNTATRRPCRSTPNDARCRVRRHYGSLTVFSDVPDIGSYLIAIVEGGRAGPIWGARTGFAMP